MMRLLFMNLLMVGIVSCSHTRVTHDHRSVANIDLCTENQDVRGVFFCDEEQLSFENMVLHFKRAFPEYEQDTFEQGYVHSRAEQVNGLKIGHFSANSLFLQKNRHQVASFTVNTGKNNDYVVHFFLKRGE